MALWYLDALDARAGIGFTTYREPDLDSNGIDLGRPAVFIRPPFFRGESVASRAIGFAATRGSFQFGLFIKGKEVGFESLQGVAEFIRRVYVSSGGGDTDNGNGFTPPLPNPQNEPGGAPPISMADTEDAIVDKILMDAKGMQESSNKLSFEVQDGKHEVKFLHSLTAQSGIPNSAIPLVVYGAVLLLDELMLRAPTKHSDNCVWLQSAARIGRMVTDLGLVSTIAEHNGLSRARQLAEQYISHINAFPYPAHFPVDPLFIVLGIIRPEAFRSRFDYYPWMLGRSGPYRIASDPMDDLSLFALPTVLAVRMGLNPETTSIRDFLSIVLADPTAFLIGNQIESRMMVAVALLACVNIVSEGHPSLAPFEFQPAANDLLQDLVKDATAWMEAQMPSYLFPDPVESLVQNAIQLRYPSRIPEPSNNVINSVNVRWEIDEKTQGPNLRDEGLATS